MRGEIRLTADILWLADIEDDALPTGDPHRNEVPSTTGADLRS
jgi:hypothetical protein